MPKISGKNKLSIPSTKTKTKKVDITKVRKRLHDEKLKRQATLLSGLDSDSETCKKQEPRRQEPETSQEEQLRTQIMDLFGPISSDEESDDGNKEQSVKLSERKPRPEEHRVLKTDPKMDELFERCFKHYDTFKTLMKK